MRITKNFIKSSIIYTVAGMLPMASAIILLPFYVLHLNTSLYGALSIYLAFSLLVQIFVTYSFDSSLYLHYHEFKNDKKKLSVFVSSAFIFMLILSAVAGVLLALLGDLIFDLVLADKPVHFYPFGLAAVGTGIFQGVFKVFSSLLQSREKPETFFWSNIVMFSLIAGLTVAGIYLFPESLVGPVAGRFVASAVLGVWALYRVFKEFGVHFDFQWLKSSFGFNNYTFIYQLQLWAINYVDRFLLTTLADVGAYDFAWKCMLVYDLLINGLYNSVYPKVISIHTAQEKKHSTPLANRYYHGLTAVTMILVTAGIFALPILSRMGFLKPEYEASLQYAPFIGLVYLVRPIRQFFSLPYAVLKFTKPLPVIATMVAIVKIGLMVVFIPVYSVWAVIGASMVSVIVEVVLFRYLIGSRFEYKYNVFKVVLAPLLLGALILVLEITLTVNKDLLHAAYVICCGGMLWWLYSNELKALFEKQIRGN